MLSHRPLREADRIYSILTRDFGLIQASASGVRKEQSKLRGSLEPFSFSKMSLVKGKEYWRITNAVFERYADKHFAAPFALLEKLMAGESEHSELFGDIEEEIRHYSVSDELAEARMVSKMLFHLGYMEYEDLNLDKKDLVKAINKGIKASGLADQRVYN